MDKCESDKASYSRALSGFGEMCGKPRLTPLAGRLGREN